MNYRDMAEQFKAQAQALKEQAAKLEQVASLLASGVEVPVEFLASSGGTLAPVKQNVRQNYVGRFLELLEKKGKPLAVAEAARLMGVEREPLERAVWMERHRKKNPRIKRVAEGLYWFHGKPVPKAA